MQPLYWLILFVILLLIEIATMGLTTVWFAGGALVAALMSYLDTPNWMQWLGFLVVSILLFALTRPIALKYFNQERSRTNADSLIGMQGIVTEEIDTLKAKGHVQVKGMDWSARTESADGVIQRDKTVRIKEIKGVKLIVEEEK